MMNELAAFERFNGIMDRLLGEGGCPWDKEQTLFSLRQYLLEESYEAVDAVNNGDMPALCEELGDVFLEAV
ncbi:MAG: nucleoside triphosphate pyrophosphohydrolase, partial [Clostridiales bacterium]|nr:nucleoside triphosphate pyrophosphohydrolase [Clostridiales bacterium]